MRKSIFPIALLTGIGIFLRVWQIGKIPISLFGDEIDVGLQAESILTTGKDYLGNSLPVLFHSFSEYRLPIQLYLDSPFIKFFGLNAVGVRAPAVLMGFLSLIFFYLLVKEVADVKLAAIATLFMLFSPWHFNFSRQANDAGILLPFILGGTWSFLKGLKNYRFLIISSVLFSLSIYAYAISTLFTPLFVISLLIIYRKQILNHSKRELFIAAAVGLLILSPYANQTIKGRASSRFNYISVINKDDLISEVLSERKWSNTPLSKLFYNKFSVASYRLMGNYLKAISPDFLFVNGDPNPRQSVSGFGVFYHFDFVLIIIGAYAVINNLVNDKKNVSKYLFFVVWIALAPLPSILTKGGGTHASRLILMLPPLIFISSLGFYSLLNRGRDLKFKLIILVLAAFMVFDVGRFFHRYFVIWPNESWRAWQYGFEEFLSDVKKIDSDYSLIYFNNTYEPILPRFLFWYAYDMNLFQKQFTRDVHVEGIMPGFNGFSLGDKYYFGELVKPIEPLAQKGHLVVASAEKDVTDPTIFNRSDLKLIKTYYSPEDTPIFYVFTAN